MKKISTIILAGKQDGIITSCFESVAWTDEIILVNINSDKNTLDIANKFKSKIIKGYPKYDFSIWRNQGAKIAKGDWLLYLDTDEKISLQLKSEIISTINNIKKEINAYYIPRKNYFWGKEFKSSWPDYQLRLIKKSALKKWIGNIHETASVSGKIGYLKNYLVHNSHRSINSCLKNTLFWSWLEAENRYKTDHPQMTSWRFLRVIITEIWNEFLIKKIWREGIIGIIEGIYQVFSLFITYLRLWELQKKRK